MIYDPKLQFYADQLQGAVLDTLEVGEETQTYLLRRHPDRYAFSCFIVFAPFGIVIAGDISISDSGVIARGMDADWFAGNLQPDYLASKFLKKKWVPELARQFWGERLASWKQELADHNAEVEAERDAYITSQGSAEGFQQWPPDNEWLRSTQWRVGFPRHTLNNATVIDAVQRLLDDRDCFDDPHILFESLPSFMQRDGVWMMPFSDSMGGYDYYESEIGWLFAVQRAFARLYPAIKQEQEKETGEDVVTEIQNNQTAPVS